MKITVDIDCTAAEARELLGLPDVKPMQEEMMRDMTEKMQAGVAAMDPDQAMRTWLAPNTQAVEQMQRMFAQFYGTASGSGDKT